MIRIFLYEIREITVARAIRESKPSQLLLDGASLLKLFYDLTRPYLVVS